MTFLILSTLYSLVVGLPVSVILGRRGWSLSATCAVNLGGLVVMAAAFLTLQPLIS